MSEMGAATDTLKQVLFVTYYFPPSGGPGVQRSLKFTKYLPGYGWRPTVLTVRPEHASYPDLDPDLAEEIPDSVDVERTYAWDPYALYARVLQQEKQDVVSVGFLGESEMNVRQHIARWIRANIFLPDARVGWVPFAVTRGRELLRRDRFDAVFTTGPPHSTHLVGLALSLLHDVPWLADFRDPWTRIDYQEALPITAPARAVDSWIERTVLKNASLATVRSESMGSYLLNSAQTPMVVIENGFDPEDFEGIEASIPKDRFVVAHVGNVNDARDPAALWKALREMDARKRMPRLRIAFVGNVERAVLASAARYGVGDLVDILPYLPHEQAVRRMKASTALLLSINNVSGARGIVPGKIYEYVASGRPILGIGPPGGDAARVLAESNAGRMFDFEDVDGVRTYLRASYEAWETGRPLEGASWDRAQRYSRKQQAGRLAEGLNAVTSDTSG